MVPPTGCVVDGPSAMATTLVSSTITFCVRGNEPYAGKDIAMYSELRLF